MLSKEELKARLDALWDDSGVEGALAEIESCFKRGGKFISETDLRLMPGIKLQVMNYI